MIGMTKENPFDYGVKWEVAGSEANHATFSISPEIEEGTKDLTERFRQIILQDISDAVREVCELCPIKKGFVPGLYCTGIMDYKAQKSATINSDSFMTAQQWQKKVIISQAFCV